MAWKDDHPIVNVLFKDAEEFCTWAAQKSGRKIHLPTEQEWEEAARGADGKEYPWGNQDPNRTSAAKLLWVRVQD